MDGLDSASHPATGGLRNATGRGNGDGTVTIYATTSVVSAAVEPGAAPNRLVAITDQLSFRSASEAGSEQFVTLQTAAAGEVLRGVTFAPVDKTAPQLTVQLSRDLIWPPNNQFVEIAAAISVSDNLDPNPSVKLESIFCNDCADPGSEVIAQPGVDSRTFSIRAARSGQSLQGRVYTVTYSAVDASGNSTTQQATITVPHDQR